MKSNPANLADFYKTGHRVQYPVGTEYVYSNFTPRTSRVPGDNQVMFFGLQYFVLEYMIKQWNEGFFKKPKAEAVAAYKRRLDTSLGQDAVAVDHMEALHDLGYLPISIKALPEGMLVPLQVPMLTMVNTDPRFGWVTNYLETIFSVTMWGPCTSATTAFNYRRVFEDYAAITGSPAGFVPWQGHDFSMRGMFGLEAACLSGAGHLLSFTGTDTIPAIDFLEEYYGGNANWQMIGGSVGATEHSVVCAGGQENERETLKRLLTEVYPKGIFSFVSDSWDFWNLVTVILPSLKAEIMAREGKLVIRPDSGDPVKILVGDPDAAAGTPENKGLIELLWDTFGGTTTDKGFKVVDSHVGAIYGDSITRERQLAILSGLAAKGFASCNVVLGIGSYTYQYATRDTYGFAIKATHATVNGESRDIFKNPKTDTKKVSHRGLIYVGKDPATGRYVAEFPVSPEREAQGELKEVFRDGKLIAPTTLAEIRGRIEAQLKA